MKIKLTKKTIIIALAGIMIVTVIVFLTMYKRNTAAYVNDIRISVVSINSRFDSIKKREPSRFSGQSGPAEEQRIKRMLLDNQIALATIGQYATKAGIKVSEKEVDQAVAKLRQGYKTSAAFEAALAKEGTDETYLRDLFRNEIAGAKMRIRLAKNVKISKREVETYAEKNAAEFEKGVPQVKLTVLTVQDNDQATKATKLLKASGGFDSAARKMGERSDLGWQRESDLGPSVVTVLSKIDVGEHTSAVPNPDSTLSIYKLDDRQTRKSSPIEIRKQVKSLLLSRKQRSSFNYWYEGIQDKVEVQIFM